jgi:hypothetical protein
MLSSLDTTERPGRLGLLAGADYHRAVDLVPIRGAAPPRGRALDPGELRADPAAVSPGRLPLAPRTALASPGICFSELIQPRGAAILAIVLVGLVVGIRVGPRTREWLVPTPPVHVRERLAADDT